MSVRYSRRVIEPCTSLKYANFAVFSTTSYQCRTHTKVVIYSPSGFGLLMGRRGFFSFRNAAVPIPPVNAWLALPALQSGLAPPSHRPFKNPFGVSSAFPLGFFSPRFFSPCLSPPFAALLVPSERFSKVTTKKEGERKRGFRKRFLIAKNSEKSYFYII